MPEISYRLAGKSDVPELVRLRLLMQVEVHGDEAVPPGFAEISRDYFLSTLREESYLSVVGEADGRLIAAAGLVVYRKPPSFGGPRGTNGYVGNVFTEKAWRRRGIAQEMMRRLVLAARAAGVDRLHLTATQDGQGVYQRVGFRVGKYPYLELMTV